MITPTLLTLALIADGVVGEPKKLWERVPHPVVLMGRAVGFLDRALNKGEDRRRKGIAAAAILVVGSFVIGGVIGGLPGGPLFELAGAVVLLAQKCLVEHVRAVAAALREGIGPARAAVRHIVGRDPALLDEPGVARAAIESAAENFSDGVVAPAFWFFLLGLPGMIAYKAINTADSMIGHRNEKYAEFGWAAARLDDLLNLIPARLSAVLIALVSRRRWLALRTALRDARTHASPNAGWPEAAMAAALDVALGGPRAYPDRTVEAPLIHAPGRLDATADDVDGAVKLLWNAWIALIVLVMALTLVTPH
jgi:adenosylcobinamide-phosphate synthase